MTSLVPRPPYSEAELRQLFPPQLKLQQVQIYFRHGERTPITNGFEHLGLLPYWPLCDVAGKLSSIALTNPDTSQWGNLPWKRRLEAIRPDGGPMSPKAANGKRDSICAIGELTDTGRRSMLQLGQRIRYLYVDQLGFMPKVMSEPESLYIRASPYPRALESTHQAFLGLYPLRFRARAYIPDIVLRSFRDETLMPNEDYCLRFIQMMKAYSTRSADRWNKTKEMDFLNSLLQRHMPSQRRVAVDSTPRISGIYDAVNATLAAQDPQIKLPAAFYDPAVRATLDKIAYEEEFGPFYENEEYRTLGIGALMGDIVERMTQSVEVKGSSPRIRMAFSGGHDSTVIGILGSLGALDANERVWPSYSSSVAVELFREQPQHDDAPEAGSSTNTYLDAAGSGLAIGRTQTAGLSSAQKQTMTGYFVRLRYNDRPVTVPGCRATGKHLPGDESFCTLAAFKEIVDKITPGDWKQACVSNMDKPAIPAQLEPAGF